MDSKTLEVRILNISLFFISFLILFLLKKTQFNNLGAIVFFTIILVLILRKVDICVELKFILLFSYIFRLMYSYYIYSNDLIRFPDTIGYMNTLDTMIKNEPISYSKVVKYAGTLHVSYHYLNYFLYKMFNTKYALYLGNIFLFFFSILFLHNHLKIKFNSDIAELMILMLTLNTSLYIYTSNILKDSLVLFLCMFSIYSYDRYKRDRKKFFFILLVVGLILLTMSRIYSGVGLILGILIDILMFKKEVINKKNIGVVIVVIVLTMMFTPLKNYFSMGFKFIKRIEISMYTILNFFKAIIAFLFSPFFWNVTKEYTVYSLMTIDSIILLAFSPLLLFFFFSFIRNKEYRRNTYIYIIPILVHILALATAYGTGGHRQKIAVYPFIILFYILGIPSYKLCSNQLEETYVKE